MYTTLSNYLVVRFRPCHNCMENVVNLLKLSGGFLGRYAIGLLVAMKTEMVNMGMRLEDGVRTGRLTKEVGSSSGTKKYGSGFPKKKEHDAKPFTRNLEGGKASLGGKLLLCFPTSIRKN